MWETGPRINTRYGRSFYSRQPLLDVPKTFRLADVFAGNSKNSYYVLDVYNVRAIRHDLSCAVNPHSPAKEMFLPFTDEGQKDQGL